jgi:hypothetical protein
VHFVKAILTAAEAQPHALFGFIELPEMGTYPTSGLPVTAGELNVQGLVAAMPPLDVGTTLQLQSGVIEGEVTETD